MNLIGIFTRFPDQQACLEHLEILRWGDQPHCPHCGSANVGRKADGDRLGRFNCHDCKSSFNVLSGTIFEKTKLPLQKWFLAVGLIVNAEKSLSSHQLARDLELNQKSAWYMQQRIRGQMAGEQRPLLQGILEADERYMVGKPRKENSASDCQTAKRGCGTKKIKGLEVVERRGRVATRVLALVNVKNIMRFIHRVVDTEVSLPISDEYAAHHAACPVMAHAVINHSTAHVDGNICIDSTEGFWALAKQAWYDGYGSLHYYKERYESFFVFIAGSVQKYNERNNPCASSYFLRRCFQ